MTIRHVTRTAKWQNTTRGFTLLEALVVTGVLAVLAGFLFASMRDAREAARKSQCWSNMKQIGLGITMYSSEEYYNTMPKGNILGFNALYDRGNGILADTKCFCCPSVRRKMHSFPGVKDDSHTDYSLDGDLSTTDKPGKIICADEPHRYPDGTLDPQVFANHGDGANCLFMDGHAHYEHEPNPRDDTDSTSIFEGTSSTTNTYID